MDKADIMSFSLDELVEVFSEINIPKFRSRQVYEWLHKHFAVSFDEMTNISKELRNALSERFVINSCKIEKKLVSNFDDTVKYLYELNDGEYVESVVMKYHHGYSICVSTQVGCNMGCKFCASTIGGCKRNLKPSEILSQVYTAQKDTGIRISNIVMMGMGEPLDNYENVLKFLSLVTDENGINIGARHISLSTCGIVPRIYDLANIKSQLTLSISLHAPNDEIRSSMMPVNKRWGIDELLKACRYYFEKTGRRVSFEYTLVRGVNDSDECADELIEKLRDMHAHVNLIPVNNVEETQYERSNKERIKRFCERLNNNAINATVRRTLGSDINASCGQLRKKSLLEGGKKP